MKYSISSLYVCLMMVCVYSYGSYIEDMPEEEEMAEEERGVERPNFKELMKKWAIKLADKETKEFIQEAQRVIEKISTGEYGWEFDDQGVAQYDPEYVWGNFGFTDPDLVENVFQKVFSKFLSNQGELRMHAQALLRSIRIYDNAVLRAIDAFNRNFSTDLGFDADTYMKNLVFYFTGHPEFPAPNLFTSNPEVMQAINTQKEIYDTTLKSILNNVIRLIVPGFRSS